MSAAEVLRVRQLISDKCITMQTHVGELASAVRRSDFDAEDAGYALDQFAWLRDLLQDDLYYLRGLLEGSLTNE